MIIHHTVNHYLTRFIVVLNLLGIFTLFAMSLPVSVFESQRSRSMYWQTHITPWQPGLALCGRKNFGIQIGISHVSRVLCQLAIYNWRSWIVIQRPLIICRLVQWGTIWVPGSPPIVCQSWTTLIFTGTPIPLHSGQILHVTEWTIFNIPLLVY